MLLERAGAREKGGSVTGVYTVLMEGDDLADPVADAAISVLDGQIVLARKLAGTGHYPAIDVLRSVSRVMQDVADDQHRAAAATVRHILSILEEHEDLVNLGMYVTGTNPALDQALAVRDQLVAFLRQSPDETVTPGEMLRELESLAALATQHSNVVSETQ